MMWFSRSSSTFLAVFALCTTSVLTVPTVEVNRVHESRPHPPSGWTRQEGLLKTTVLPFRIALTQSNLHQLDDLLMSVSHPESEQYGQHWTIDQVAKTFAPSQESVDAVGSWLSSHGIGVERTSRSRSLGWLHFNATIEEAENLLKAEYSAWKHESGGIHVACNKYHVPQNIAEHIGMTYIPDVITRLLTILKTSLRPLFISTLKLATWLPAMVSSVERPQHPKATPCTPKRRSWLANPTHHFKRYTVSWPTVHNTLCLIVFALFISSRPSPPTYKRTRRDFLNKVDRSSS